MTEAEKTLLYILIDWQRKMSLGADNDTGISALAKRTKLYSKSVYPRVREFLGLT